MGTRRRQIRSRALELVVMASSVVVVAALACPALDLQAAGDPDLQAAGGLGHTYLNLHHHHLT
ncbi:hypothetical protein E2562_000908 [Oryza meyeriana var. granulata]|uniref:Uncharacterized protein n=1 Tax=Oryza meyeriana var. granulata TaxID=110450 RepID=A0A6G1CXB2_9ORYZ|nr:hypothetical protein E2562_000908 [Oryza meyeriana var. granulata]